MDVEWVVAAKVASNTIMKLETETLDMKMQLD